MRVPPVPAKPTKEQEKLLKRYAILMVRRANKMIAGKPYGREDAEQTKVMDKLDALGFDLDKLYLTMYDYGYEAEALKKEGK